MNQENRLPFRLKILTILTAAALAGIVVLQAYWLSSSFSEQKSRFSADVENALLSTQIRSQLMNSDQEASLYLPDIGNMVSAVMSTLPPELTLPHQSMVTRITFSEDSTSSRAKMLRKFLKGDSGSYTQTTVDTQYHRFVISTNSAPLSRKDQIGNVKKLFDEELKKRAIHTQFELAMLDSTGSIEATTLDAASFRNIPLKFTMARLQVAFPDANLYLLRRMAWLLSVTILLILISCFSFAYLLKLFYRQKRLSDMRNDFMNNMTHELKTPISSVSVVLEMMQDKRHPVSEDTRQEYYSIAQGELKRLTMLVEKVLKMAAFEKSEIQLAKESFAAGDWVQDILRSLRPVFGSAGAVVDVSVQPQDLVLHADKTHLTNVLQNLVENALKYNDKPMPKLRIELVREGHAASLRVTDNGKGIPGAYIDKVFDKFFRVPSGDRHDTKGYGLGLSYVKAITELHGGQVHVSSVIGEGSTFTVQLPE